MSSSVAATRFLFPLSSRRAHLRTRILVRSQVFASQVLFVLRSKSTLLHSNLYTNQLAILIC
uniref:Putative ovule protein n=1 Tax=Solanum chacoense TaxID=4108 RepID=A0A0V0GF46_SOLCH